MPDPRALVRIVDELLWALRRAGFAISTAQAIDVGRAVRAVGLDEAWRVREAVAAVVLDRATDRPRFVRAFDAFFAARQDAVGTLWDRLAAGGFGDSDLATLRELLADLAGVGTDGLVPLGMLLERGADLDRALSLAGLARTLDAHAGLQLGFLTHRLLGQVGVDRARRALAALHARLLDALGDRGARLAEALGRELDRAQDDVRAYVRQTFDERVEEVERQREGRRLATTPFAALSDAEIEDVRRAVRRLAERLRGGARVRARHARRGRIDPHRTLRRALRTSGVPLALARKARRRDRPRLVLLCDVSDSVRAAAAFLLEFAYAVHELFDRTRSFVFVSDLGETTQLFAREPVRVAIARAWGGGVVGAGDNSNYGRALRAFEARALRDIDKRTIVVVLGDGRTNYLDPAAEVLDRIRTRARALLWLCPEPRGQWSHGDSAMAAYAPRCTSVAEVRCAADLERAAASLARR